MQRSTARLPAQRLPAVLRRLGAALALAAPACFAAEGDICENKTGRELVRCIEAAARPGAPGDPGKPEGRAASQARGADAGGAPLEPRNAAEDCRGRQGSELRRCLAAGGRLPPSAAVESAPAAPTRSPSADASCEGRSGEALRACREAAAKSKGMRPEPQLLRCTGYTLADQPLCLHRNAAIIACRNRKLYPDLDVCLRSHMSAAPQPGQVECTKVPARAKAHCEARNRVYAGCSADKMAYFGCLEQKLGEDAVLPPVRAGSARK